jgi:hypothetical protein
MKIAVLSRNPKLFSTQRLIEEIEKAGHEAMVVDHSLCDLIIEQEGPSIIYKGQRLEGVDATLEEAADAKLEAANKKAELDAKTAAMDADAMIAKANADIIKAEADKTNAVEKQRLNKVNTN